MAERLGPLLLELEAREEAVPFATGRGLLAFYWLVRIQLVNDKAGGSRQLKMASR